MDASHRKSSEESRWISTLQFSSQQQFREILLGDGNFSSRMTFYDDFRWSNLPRFHFHTSPLFIYRQIWGWQRCKASHSFAVVSMNAQVKKPEMKREEKQIDCDETMAQREKETASCEPWENSFPWHPLHFPTSTKAISYRAKLFSHTWRHHHNPFINEVVRRENLMKIAIAIMTQLINSCLPISLSLSLTPFTQLPQVSIHPRKSHRDLIFRILHRGENFFTAVSRWGWFPAVYVLPRWCN